MTDHVGMILGESLGMYIWPYGFEALNWHFFICIADES